MKKTQISIGFLAAALVLVSAPGCSSLSTAFNSMDNAGQDATVGAAAGAAAGTGIGALIDGGRGTWIGALVGAGIGAAEGALIGHSMDRQKQALEQELAQVRNIAVNDSAQAAQNSQAIDEVKVNMVKDSNDLDAIHLVLGDDVLFNTNSYTLSPEAQAVLARVAYNLKQFPNTDVTILGYTDNTGTPAYNQTLSLERAQSVLDQLVNDGIASTRMTAKGMGESDPIVSNATAAGRAQNRRVELYITAGKDMIEQANSQASF